MSSKRINNEQQIPKRKKMKLKGECICGTNTSSNGKTFDVTDIKCKIHGFGIEKPMIDDKLFALIQEGKRDTPEYEKLVKQKGHQNKEDDNINNHNDNSISSV